MPIFGVSKEAVVTLKYYHEKTKNVAETTLSVYFLKLHQGYFEVVSTTDSELWHIQNSRDIGKPVNIPSETIGY